MAKKQKAKRVFLTAFLVLLGLVGLRFFLMMAGSRGGGQSLNSPNGLYKANAMSVSMKRFWGGRKEYYEFWITKNATGDSLRSVRIEPLDKKRLFWMRGGDKIITWAPDSSEVVFAFQDVELKLKVEGHKE